VKTHARQVGVGQALARIGRRAAAPPPAGGTDHGEAALARRRELLRQQGYALPAVAGTAGDPPPAELAGTIEHHVGFARVPLGVIGPLRVNRIEAHGDYYVPLATTEGALVASYNRGAYAVRQAGGVSVVSLTESISRAPCFVFDTMPDALQFLG
jgi:hydroxymethylglutaryl-CoA reductase (NADPH)